MNCLKGGGSLPKHVIVLENKQFPIIWNEYLEKTQFNVPNTKTKFPVGGLIFSGAMLVSGWSVLKLGSWALQDLESAYPKILRSMHQSDPAQAWATVFQQPEISQTGIVPGILLKPDKYGNATTDLICIYIIYIDIFIVRTYVSLFLVDPIVPEDFANILTSEDHLSNYSLFCRRFEVAQIN